ncbi:hypothetical protein SVIOM342S_02904 [Streptomyces violaceorubidus]
MAPETYALPTWACTKETTAAAEPVAVDVLVLALLPLLVPVEEPLSVEALRVVRSAAREARSAASLRAASSAFFLASAAFFLASARSALACLAAFAAAASRSACSW